MAAKAEGIKKYSLLMILGGAIGNVFDRLFNRSVPDFLDFHIGNFHWFIFNIADVFITTGVIFMILIEIIGNNKN
jgi:signal peptidase II